MNKIFNKVFTVILISYVILCSIFLYSCDSNDKKCGVEGELEIRVGSDFHYYCNITAFFRENSIIFEDDAVLLVNLYGQIFEGDITKAQMLEESKSMRLITLSESIRHIFEENDIDNIDDNKKYEIKGNRHMLIQIPFKGTGIYPKESIYLVLFEDGKRIAEHIPNSTDTAVSINIATFVINNITDNDIQDTVYIGLSDEELKELKKVSFTGRITGNLIIEGEKKSITGDFDFSHILRIPEDSPIYSKF